MRCDILNYLLIAIILHNFEDEDLIGRESTSIAIDEVPEEIKKLRFVMTINFIFLLNSITDKLDERNNFGLVKEHILIIIIHFFKEINTANILINMMHHLRNKRY